MTLLVSHFKLLSIFFDGFVVFMPKMKRFRESEYVWMGWGEICVGRRSRHSFKSGNFFQTEAPLLTLKKKIFNKALPTTEPCSIWIEPLVCLMAQPREENLSQGKVPEPWP